MAGDKKISTFSTIGSVLVTRAMDDAGGHITREFQDYGYRLAMDLDDLAHKALYIKMAKTVDRSVLEAARTFVLDANAKSKARLFMWKVKQIRQDIARKKKSAA